MEHFSPYITIQAGSWLCLGLLVLPLSCLAQTTVTRAALAPAANARAASRSAPVVVPFSQVVSPATAGTIRLFSAQYQGRRAVTASVNGSTVTLTPTVATGSAAFCPGETVQVTVPATVQSLGGTAAMPYVYYFTTAATGGSGSFSGGSDLSVSNQISSLTLGDVDGDGDLDALIGNAAGNTINVCLNNGRGTFSSGATPSVSYDPRSVAVGDVDGDGDLDLVTVHPGYNGLVGVRLNNGSGSFSGGTDLPGFYRPSNVVLGDVDGDGDLDLVVTNLGDNSVAIQLNSGSGTFSGGSVLAVGSRPDSVALGDVDGDGDLDIVVANNDVSGTVSLGLNAGNGTFRRGTDLPAGSNPSSVTLGNVDGDGDLDLVVADSGYNAIHIRLNNGSGLFAGGSDLTVGVQPTSVTLGDVDGDGDLDLVAVNSAGSPRTSVGLNDGSGTFSRGATPPSGLAAQGVALGDVDGDGDLDFVTLDPISRSLTVRLNGGGTLPTRLATSLSALSVYPNPGRGAVQVSGLAAGAPVAVVDALGRCVATATATVAGLAQVQLPLGLAAGLYIVRSEERSRQLTVE